MFFDAFAPKEQRAESLVPDGIAIGKGKTGPKMLLEGDKYEIRALDTISCSEPAPPIAMSARTASGAVPNPNPHNEIHA